jgi:hypothetical protein
MPIDLMSKWAGKPDGERNLIRIVEEAEEVFLRALTETVFENNMGNNSGEYL